MLHHERSLDINASPEEIWAVVGRYMHIDEFAPMVKSVDALTNGEDGLGSKRRNNFENGSSVVEEVIAWEPNKGYRVRLSEMDMPLHEATAEISIKPLGSEKSTVIWGMDYHVKYGPLGWLLGQTMMKMMMGKIIDGNLQGLAEVVASNQKAASPAI